MKTFVPNYTSALHLEFSFYQNFNLALMRSQKSKQLLVVGRSCFGGYGLDYKPRGADQKNSLTITSWTPSTPNCVWWRCFICTPIRTRNSMMPGIGISCRKISATKFSGIRRSDFSQRLCIHSLQILFRTTKMWIRSWDIDFPKFVCRTQTFKSQPHFWKHLRCSKIRLLEPTI